MEAPRCRTKKAGNTIPVLQAVKHDITEVSAVSGSPKIKAGTQWSYTGIAPKQSSVGLNIYKTPTLGYLLSLTQG